MYKRCQGPLVDANALYVQHFESHWKIFASSLTAVVGETLDFNHSERICSHHLQKNMIFSKNY